MRLTGGLFYLGGFVLMTFNLLATIRSGERVNGEAKVAVRAMPKPVTAGQLLRGAPVVLSVLIIVFAAAFGVLPIVKGVLALFVVLALAFVAYVRGGAKDPDTPRWHQLIEGRPLLFTLFVVAAVLAGGIAELIPAVVIRAGDPVPEAAETAAAQGPPPQEPYTPLELEGRDIYVREGCYNCHSQMIRPFRHETLRYGDYSRLEEFRYDHPFQFGSKRTGPDLHREGGRYPNLWHYQHLMDPRSTSPGSNMPMFAWMRDREVDLSATPGKLRVLRKLGVPYSDAVIAGCEESALAQGRTISEDLAAQDVTIAPGSEMVALIAYLQRLGRPPVFPLEPADRASAGTPDSPAGTRPESP
jgi:cytochrome c oxidase cbb3-type subunit I/II